MVQANELSNNDLYSVAQMTEYEGSAKQFCSQLNAHLRWCAFLGSSLENECLSDLVVMLDEATLTMQKFTKIARKLAED